MSLLHEKPAGTHDRSHHNLHGRIHSELTKDCAMERAEETVQKHETMSLNAENSKAFLNGLSGDLNFNQELTESFEDHSRRTICK